MCRPARETNPLHWRGNLTGSRWNDLKDYLRNLQGIEMPLASIKLWSQTFKTEVKNVADCVAVRDLE